VANIKVIGEEVKTESQRDLLLMMNCDYGQGYFFSRPVSADGFEVLLDHSRQ